jgi:hypothetical protein
MHKIIERVIFIHTLMCHLLLGVAMFIFVYICADYAPCLEIHAWILTVISPIVLVE